MAQYLHDTTSTYILSLIMRLPPKHRDVLKIGELAAPDRNEGGTRLYARKDLKRMAIA
ncbi:hypothetical protein [Methylomonas sp. 11b]|uniref:hypothetical protein n=1 Tax=Methylomonas sp. 11b TaxID=1168169 RepID=UPI0012DE9553|nr:hypothetical protein [Methylomonas sp. 11b]